MLEITLADARALLDPQGNFPTSLHVGDEDVDVVSYNLETNIVVVKAPSYVTAWDRIVRNVINDPLDTGKLRTWVKRVFSL